MSNYDNPDTFLDGLGLPPEEKGYDSMEDTLHHLSLVRKNLKLCLNQIALRSWHHDESKLESPEKEILDRETPLLRSLPINSEEYRECLKRMEIAYRHHFQKNSHHPEHYSEGIRGMDLFDLLEMVCDWQAHTSSRGGKIELGWKQKRFGIEPQLLSILENTITRYFKTNDSH